MHGESDLESKTAFQRVESLKELRYFTAALLGAAESSEHGGHPDREMIDAVGWALVQAVLVSPDSNIDLWKLVPQIPGLAMEKASPSNQTGHPDSVGSLLKDDPSFLSRLAEALRAPYELTNTDELRWKLCNDISVTPMPDEGSPPNIRRVVMLAWRTLASGRSDTYPAKLAFASAASEADAKSGSFVYGEWTWTSLDFLKAAWVCELVADALERETRSAPASPVLLPLPGSLTLGAIRKKYKLDKLETDRLRHRLSYHQQKHRTEYQSSGGEGDRPKYLYPVELAETFIGEIRGGSST